MRRRVHEPGGERPHVLMLVDALEDGTGGAERFAAGLAAAVAAGGDFRVSLCATRHAEGYLPRSLDEAGVEHFALNRSRTLDPAAFRRLARFLRDEKVDVLHCHKFGSNVWGSMIGRGAGAPAVIAHEHTWSYEGQPLRRFLDGQVVGRLCDRFVSVSNADRERMIALEGVPARKTITIPTSYIARREGPIGDLRAELGIAPGAPTAGTIAQLRPQKALGVLIDAWRLVVDELPAAQLILVGDGPDRALLEEHAARVGLADSVRFLGTRNDLGTIFGGLDVAVLSSDFEGLPLFAFESIAHATPLVATDVGGLPDLVEDGKTGVLVPPRDPQALGEALATLLKDGDRRTELAAAATELLPAFSMESIARRFGDLYRTTLAERPAR
jgi:glycosyltransferase involved in cell wall biosynthesis